MNIFQLLGLPAEHRKENKVTQLVKHYDEVKEKHKQNKRQAIQIKEDGVCAITVIRDGIAIIFSRTGRKFTNTSHLCHNITNLSLNDGVYFGEMVCDTVSLEVLSGAVNPNRKKELKESDDGFLVPMGLRMRFFDLISIDSFIKGTSSRIYLHRYAKLESLIRYSERLDSVSVIELIPAFNEEQINGHLDALVERGEEGLVIVDLDANWEAGHKGWRKMKKVRGCDYDLLCVGYEEGTGKYTGKVANLIFSWKNGQTIKAMLGKGWTHQMAKEMFDVIKHTETHGKSPSKEHSNPIGKIFQVYALEESSKGKLRLPKVGEQRFDKGVADV